MVLQAGLYIVDRSVHPPQLVLKVSKDGRGRRFGLDCIAGAAVVANKLLNLTEPFSDPRFRGLSNYDPRYPIHHVLCAPIRYPHKSTDPSAVLAVRSCRVHRCFRHHFYCRFSRLRINTRFLLSATLHPYRFRGWSVTTRCLSLRMTSDSSTLCAFT
jgi:hypothetical protein